VSNRTLFLLLFAALLAARLCHTGILWAEESLPLAVAQQVERGQVIYRDLWFDKPPLLSLVCLLWGARDGWILRLAGTLYSLLACAIAWMFARDLWGEREGRIAAALLGFFFIFDIPASVTPLAADPLMLAPHLAAVWLAHRRRAFGSGVCAGIAFLINAKGAIAATVCVIWFPAGIVLFAAGFAAVNGVALGWLWWAGALGAYYQQVWQWGRVYAAVTFLADPVRNGAVRTLNWAGFHGALVAGAAMALRDRKLRVQWVAWLALSFGAVALGWRFFPRYFFQILPALVLLGARGLAVMPARYARVAALLLLIPLVRFGPRYVLLAAGQSTQWADTAMDRDSHAAARLTKQLARPGDSLFVWGFRPDIYVYAGLPSGARFLDSQPLTGVPADRHLTQSAPVAPELAAAHRAELIRAAPTFVIDGLGPYNPNLAITRYPDLKQWLAQYREAGRSAQTIVYRRE